MTRQSRFGGNRPQANKSASKPASRFKSRGDSNTYHRVREERRRDMEASYAFRNYPERVKLDLGESVNVIFLDNNSFDPNLKDNGLPYIIEHIFTGKRGNNLYASFHEECAGTIGERCPHCEGLTSEDPRAARRLEANFYLSVLLLNPKYKDKKTGQWVAFKDKDGRPYSYFRKLLPLLSEEKLDSNGQASYEIYTYDIINLLKKAYNEINPETGKPYGSIRGVGIKLKRPVGKFSHVIGRPTPLNDEGKMYTRFTESQLIQKYGHPAKTKAGTNEVYMEANAMIQPFDYTVVFPEPTEEYICNRFNIPYNPVHGSGDNDIYEQDSEQMDIPDFDDDLPDNAADPSQIDDFASDNSEEDDTPTGNESFAPNESDDDFGDGIPF